MIVADNIAYKRGNKTLFHRSSFRFDQPEFVAVIGPNGAGKSTLLQLLSGYYTPTEGKVLIHEKPAPEWKPAELAKYRAYLQQQQSVFESFSVEDVLQMGRSIHFKNGSRPTDAGLIERTLGDLELLPRRNQPFNHLSGGEQQRVQFARTLLQLNEPGTDSLEGKVLFLDEPLNNLDLYYQYNLLQMARRDVINRKGTVIAVLHDLNMAYRFADRVIVLSEGKTIIDAPAEEALKPELLSAIYQMKIEKAETPNQLPFFAVTSMPATASALNLNSEKAGIKQ
jgi:iron complex transport system ATP-binding protein